MSREIKFRVWTGKKMVYIGHENNDTALWIEEGNNWDAVDHFTGTPKSIVDSRNTNAALMQFTGLKDKNGKEIYEGDIIRCFPGRDFYREVVFHSDHYLLINRTNDTPFPLGVVYTSHQESEVVGNIFENTELMGTPGRD